MSTLQTTPGFDIETLRRGIEERDAHTLRDLYAHDAVLTVVDQRDDPTHPRTLTGTTEITGYLDEINNRDMDHHLERVFLDTTGKHAAYQEACRYPNGTRVLCVSILDLAQGHIIHQTGIQAWDQ